MISEVPPVQFASWAWEVKNKESSRKRFCGTGITKMIRCGMEIAWLWCGVVWCGMVLA